MASKGHKEAWTNRKVANLERHPHGCIKIGIGIPVAGFVKASLNPKGTWK